MSHLARTADVRLRLLDLSHIFLWSISRPSPYLHLHPWVRISYSVPIRYFGNENLEKCRLLIWDITVIGQIWKKKPSLCFLTYYKLLLHIQSRDSNEAMRHPIAQSAFAHPRASKLKGRDPFDMSTAALQRNICCSGPYGFIFSLFSFSPRSNNEMPSIYLQLVKISQHTSDRDKSSQWCKLYRDPRITVDLLHLQRGTFQKLNEVRSLSAKALTCSLFSSHPSSGGDIWKISGSLTPTSQTHVKSTNQRAHR